MDIKGKTTIFVKEVGNDTKIKIFETSFSRKDKEGNFVDSVSVRVEFDKNFLNDEGKAKFKVGYAYPMEIEEGFITTRSYTNKDGKKISNLMLYVKKAKTTGKPKEIKYPSKKMEEAINEDMPF